MAYYVEEKKKLCEECTTKTRNTRKERKSRLNLFCEKHNKPIRIHCKTHDVSVCHLCATIDHVQQSCVRQDVEEVIAEKKKQFLELQAKARDSSTMWKKRGNEVRLCEDDAKKHLKLVRDQVDSFIVDKIKTANVRAEREAALINKEADDEIRRINGKKEKLLKQGREYAENQLKSIEDQRRVLHSDVTMIYDTIHKKVKDLQKEAIDLTESIDNAAQRIEDVIQDDEKLVSDTREVIETLRDALGKTVEEGVVEHITRTVRGVRFIEGVGSEKYHGRIGGYGGKWELSETISIPRKDAFIAGSTCDTVIMSSHSISRHTCIYVMDLTDKIVIEKTFSSNAFSVIWCCAMLNQDRIICGMCSYLNVPTRNTLDDAIRLYDKQWNLIKSISIPHNTNEAISAVDVVGKDGMIIAAEINQAKIYVINPTDGRIVDTVTCKHEIALRGMLSSGDFIAIPSPVNDNVLIIDRKGNQREIAIGGKVYNCGIDPITEDLYPVYRKEGQDSFNVGHLKSNSNGVEKARDMLEYTPSAVYGRYARLNITPSGRLVVCDGKDCLVYRKTFSL